MTIDFETPVEDLSPEKISEEIRQMNEPGSPIFDTKPYNSERDRWQTRREQLYNARHKEDAGVPIQDQGLHTTLKRAGLTSAKQIERETALARGEAAQVKVDTDIKNCESSLRAEWGASYQENLSFAKVLFKTLEISDLDKAWLEHSPPDGGPALANDPEFVKAFVQVGRLIVQHGQKYENELTQFVKKFKSKKRR